MRWIGAGLVCVICVTALWAADKAPAATQGSLQRVHWFLNGRVQGVGFRYFTQTRARELKIRGWVRNLPDGRVELEAEGGREAMGRFRKAVERGPRGAEVKKIEEGKKSDDQLGEFETRATPEK